MKRYLRFSLATLLILMTIVAAYLGGYRSGRQAGTVDKTNLDHVRISQKNAFLRARCAALQARATEAEAKLAKAFGVKPSP